MKITIPNKKKNKKISLIHNKIILHTNLFYRDMHVKQFLYSNL